MKLGLGLLLTIFSYFNTNWDNKLAEAAGNGDFNRIINALDHGAKIDAKVKISAWHNDNHDAYRTALMHAVYAGKKEIVQLLLHKHANINEKDSDGKTALMLAAARGNLEIVRLLLENGALIDEKSSDGRTALMYAVHVAGEQVMKLLLENGADINIKNADGNTALIFAANMGYADNVRLLLRYNAKVDEKNNEGFTALMYAAKIGYKLMIYILLEAGANVNEKNKYGTVLMFGASARSPVKRYVKFHNSAEFKKCMVNEAEIDIIELLLQKGALNINEQNYLGETALMKAAHDNISEEAVALLLENGADVTLRNHNGDTALDIARKTGCIEAVHLLKNAQESKQISNKLNN